MADIKRLSGPVLFFVAFILMLVASVSVPFFKTVDIVHTTTSAGGVQIEKDSFGIWGICVSVLNTNLCQDLGHGYSAARFSFSSGKLAVGVKSSWTRGLVLHPIATAVVFVTFVTSIVVPNQRTTIITGSIGALLTLITLAIDIAFNILTRNAVDKLTNAASTSFGPGFYLTLVGFVATIAGVVLVYIRRRGEDDAWDSIDSSSISLNFLKKPLSRFKN